MKIHKKAIVEHEGEHFIVEKTDPTENEGCCITCDLKQKCVGEIEDINQPGLIMNRCIELLGPNSYLKKQPMVRE